MPVLLTIDDDASIHLAYRWIFTDPAITLVAASSATEGLEMVIKRHPDVILLDINLPDFSGLEAFRRIREIDARIPIIFVTGSGTTDTAIEAMKLGAYEYLLKDQILEPAQTEKLRELVTRTFEISRLMRVPAVIAELEKPEGPADVLVGHCPAMQEVYKAIGRVASQEVTVLILGDSGTGKELVARAIYHHGQRSAGPFLAINCAAIPETLLESEMFGHEKGAFTGADRKRIGKFEQCSGGTLFLDEIGDMTPLTQAKILRVLQEKQFERVGGTETVQTNVRLITATNRDLEQMVADCQFRGDLYYRLSVFTIKLPPLRERGGDLAVLAEHFLKRFNRELGKDVRRIAPEALAVLASHGWPGNLRELQSVLKQALLQAAGPVLAADFLPPQLRFREPQSRLPPDPAHWESFIADRIQAGTKDLYGEALSLMERSLIGEVLKYTRGNQVQAAKILGIARNSLRTKIRTLGMLVERTVVSDEDETEPGKKH